MKVQRNFSAYISLQGVAGAEKMFIMSNVPLTSILPSNVDPNAFLAQHTVIFSSIKNPFPNLIKKSDLQSFQELDFLSKVDSILKNETPSTSQVNISFRYSLEKYLRDATHLTTDEVCSWIQVLFLLVQCIFIGVFHIYFCAIEKVCW
jgi:hypothetical protein